MEKIIPVPSGARAFLVGLRLLSQPEWVIEDHLDELADLAQSSGAEVVGRAVQRRKAPHSATFIGPGKAEELSAAMAELEADLVVFDDDLTPSQAQKLEKLIERPVMDRSALILEIFRLRAKTREAKTQVELAQLRYLLPRLTRLWGHLSRQVGGIGVRGGEGEKQLEMDRRLVRRRIDQLAKDLERIARTRRTQRQGRRDAIEISLAGYTNAGKSTLFNRLTGKTDAPARNRLFETLDSKLRQGSLGDGRIAVFADTVGFIRKLPHHLVASFKSTLEEVVVSDLVLHVVDGSHPGAEDQRRVADEVLADLGVDPDRVLTVWNKADRLEHEPPSGDRLWVSAATGQGIEALREAMTTRLAAVAGLPVVVRGPR